MKKKKEEMTLPFSLFKIISKYFKYFYSIHFFKKIVDLILYKIPL